MGVTNMDKLIGSAQALEMCVCTRDKAVYICNKTSCVDYKTQRLYCMACINDEPPKHDHRPEIIIIINDNFKNDWKELRRIVD